MATTATTAAVAAVRLALIASALGIARPAVASQLRQDPALDRAFHDLWGAHDASGAAAAAGEILATGAPVGQVYQGLRAGRTYSARVPKGRLILVRRDSAEEDHRYVLVVPSTYDPAVPSPVRFYLHGGVNTEDRDMGERWDFDRFSAAGELTVFPSAWRGAMWWHENQVDNLLAILADLKRTYNVDENRVTVVGVSDGGSGAFFLADKVPTPLAAAVSLIGSAGILANPQLLPAGPLYVPNLRNVPLYVVNGSLDPLYPVAEMVPYIALFQAAGADLTFRPLAGSGHDLRWWPEEAPNINRFLQAHGRNPYPDRITWETDRVDRWNRAFWLVIDQLGSAPGEVRFPRFDSIVPLPALPSLGVRADPSSDHGVRILVVELGSLAARAGLIARDLIVEVDGVPTPTVRALLDATQGIDWGDTLALTVERDRLRGQVLVPLAPRPDPDSIKPTLAFPRPPGTGHVELERHGNVITVQCEGVRRYSLLLSPDRIDFSQPVRVITNGRVSFDGVVTEQATTMLRWWLRDQDRRMLFTAELQVQVP